MEDLKLMGFTEEEALVIIDVANQIGATLNEVARFIIDNQPSISAEELIQQLQQQ